MKQPSDLDLLELDIDLRLTELWRETLELEHWDLEAVGAFIRAAYGKGYCDALKEKERGELLRAHGYVVPTEGAIT